MSQIILNKDIITMYMDHCTEVHNQVGLGRS